MNQILILFAHPALEKSRVQYRLAKAARAVSGVHLHDLYELYPDFMVNVAREQQLLLEHDIIVFQHPLYWYSSPALLKEWQDLVLEHGFAYGYEGQSLQGKRLLNAISVGGSRETYCAEGNNHFTLRELLRPFEQTANLCGMTYLPPFAVHGTHNMSEAVIDTYAERYQHVLKRLQREIPPLDPAPAYLNDWAQESEG